MKISAELYLLIAYDSYINFHNLSQSAGKKRRAAEYDDGKMTKLTLSIKVTGTFYDSQNMTHKVWIMYQ